MQCRHYKGLLTLIFCIPAVAFAMQKIQQHKTIDMGALYNLTGDQAPLGKASLRGAEVAVANINAKDGIKKHQLRLQLHNGKTDPKALRHEAKSFALQKKIQIVMGLSDNNMVMAAAPAIVKAKKIFISSGATAPSLVLLMPQYLYLAAFGDNVQGAAGAEYAYNALHIKKAVLIYDKDMEYTSTLASYFTAAFVRAGGTIALVKSFSHGKFANDIIKTIKSQQNQPRLIYLAAGPTEVTAAIQKLRRNGIHAIIMGGDSYVANDIIRKLSHHADTIYFTTHVFLNPNSTNPKIREFIKLYRAKFHTTPHNAFSALAYDTTNLIAYTLNKANGFSAKDFIKALATVHNFVGVTGKISYAGGRHIPLKTVSIVRIHNNKATLAARLVPAFVPQPIR